MDPRDAAAMYNKWYKKFDEHSGMITVKLYDSDTDEEIEFEFPAKYEVCQVCCGRGTHVNPSIDAHGISAEEFHEDPDFAEDYHRGTFDVTCYACHGARVVPEIDHDSCKWTDELKKAYEKFEDYQVGVAQSRREEEYERRMGF